MTEFNGEAQPVSRFAALFNVSTDVARRAVQRGDVPGFFDGRNWYVEGKAFAKALLDKRIAEKRGEIVRTLCSSVMLDRNGFPLDIPEFSKAVEARTLEQLRSAFPGLEDWQLLDGYCQLGSAAASWSPTFGRGIR